MSNKSNAPYFPLWANDILVDEKLELLTLEEMGVLFWLWARMWRNPYKRGHLLSDHTKPTPDELLSYKFKLNLDIFLTIKNKFLTEKILKKGRYGELYSPKMSNYKTRWELEKERKCRQQQKNGNNL